MTTIKKPSLKSQKHQMTVDFVELLNIHGVSGKEHDVRDYLVEKLDSLVDTMRIDTYGNLLAEKTCGTGEGAEIILSAHMDTVKGVLKKRTLKFDGDIITSSKGALGADDRAGIAIILDVLRRVESIDFNGKIKVSFSREEEIGCVGASNIDPRWYENADLAIVVDRRGNRDIVVGTWGLTFCSNAVGYFFEEVGKLVDMEWKCVEGGVSDAMTFSGEGINSVNLSAGYMNEHTSNEYVSLEAMRETSLLICQSLAVVNSFYQSFGDVPNENDWIEKGAKYNKYYYESTFDEGLLKEDMWIEEGGTYVYEIDGEIVIVQGNNEIVLSKEEYKSLTWQIEKFI